MKKLFLSPGGAVVALICFFLPWVKFSCTKGMEETASGADLGGVFWLVFVAAILILLAFLYFKSTGAVERAKPIVLLSGIGALAVVLFKYLRFAAGTKTEFGTIRPEDIGLTIQFGFVGTIFGLLIALVGTPFLKSQQPIVDPTARGAETPTDRHPL